MNARDKLNAWHIGAAILAAVFIAGLTGSGLLFWIILVAALWVAVGHRGIR